MLTMIRCTNASCRNIIFRKGSDGMWRYSIKSMFTQGDGHQLIAICKSCKAEIPTPFIMKSITSIAEQEMIGRTAKPMRKAYDVNKEGGFSILPKEKSEKKD